MFVFLDESGKPEVYSTKGTNLVEAGGATKHLVLAAVKTMDHVALQQNVTEFKNTLLKDKSISSELTAAYALDAFHANHDKELVRRAFYEHIAQMEELEIHVIVAEKLRCKSSLKKNPVAMYGILSGLLLQGITHQDSNAEVIFSRQDNGKAMKNQLELEVERIREFY